MVDAGYTRLRKNLSERFLGTKPIGETCKFGKGGGGGCWKETGHNRTQGKLAQYIELLHKREIHKRSEWSKRTLSKLFTFIGVGRGSGSALLSLVEV